MNILKTKDTKEMSTPINNTPGTGEMSRISVGSTIKGEIQSPYDIRIDGTFEGKVISQSKVYVGDNAVIKGDIICNNAEFAGKIDGNFFVKDTLALKSKCVVNGDLHIKRLQVELDAKFNGNCKMISEEDFAKYTGESTVRPAAPKAEEPAAEPVAQEVAEEPKAAEEPSVSPKSPFSLRNSFNKGNNFPEA